MHQEREHSHTGASSRPSNLSRRPTHEKPSQGVHAPPDLGTTNSYSPVLLQLTSNAGIRELYPGTQVVSNANAGREDPNGTSDSGDQLPRLVRNARVTSHTYGGLSYKQKACTVVRRSHLQDFTRTLSKMAAFRCTFARSTSASVTLWHMYTCDDK